ncbi:TonB-dependent receptor plug domain-containing protein [Chitinophaga terrae (ex Kim and Jung 2007)]|nr:TonB-dependent receptor plug domain-containing protein [Chitinophaga terrae (ex Kim and Jung 2007)]
MIRNIITCCCMLLFLLPVSYAQVTDYNLMKEKVYLHTNHVIFQPGEPVFYKIYLVNAQTQKPSMVSKVAYVEILNPAGNVVKKQTYKIEDGYAEGSYEIGVNDAGGIYKLRAYTSLMRNESDTGFFTKEITVQKVVAPRILMKLEFPRKGYGPGDAVAATLTVRNLADKPLADHSFSFTATIAGKALLKQQGKTGKDGKAEIRFPLPTDLASNDGLLAVTLTEDGFTESISRSIPIVLGKIDLQLMPEGGTLVAGLPANIAFKAVNEFGKPADVSGAVINKNGQAVAVFNSFYGGMGSFEFTPQHGEQYTVRITRPLNISQVYAFPGFSDHGVVMHWKTGVGQPAVTLRATDAMQLKLVGTIKGKEYYRKDISVAKGEQTIVVDPANFPAGIAQFTLETSNGLPVAERLLFLNPGKLLKVSVTPDKQVYLPREKVVLKLKTTDQNGTPVPANLSLSVVDDKLWTYMDDKQDNILSWLLMSSELKGKIDYPTFYFRKDEPKATPALDLVMLTNGYRYFDYIPEVLKDGKLKFFPDESRTLSGTIVNREKKPVKAEVLLLRLSNRQQALRVVTGANGAFYFPDLNWNERYYMIARSLERKEMVSIQLTINGYGPKAQYVDKDQYALPMGKMPVPKATELDKLFEAPSPGDSKSLQDVVVVGYGITKKANLTGSVAMIRSTDLVSAELTGLLQGRVAGLEVSPLQQGTPGGAIRIRGASAVNNTPPLILVDGVPSLNGVNEIDINNISSITVLKDATATAIYGSRAANGVIVITTKTNERERVKFDLGKKNLYATMFLPWDESNYTVARRFYAPTYGTTRVSRREDFRENIYWNPVVQTDEQGEAVVQFYNSDAATTFRAITEGVGWNGTLGSAETTYATQNQLQLDLKIPYNLSVGDKPMAPLTLKNNSSEDLKLNIGVRTPDILNTGKFDAFVSVAANSSRQVLIPLEVVAAGQGEIAVTVADGDNKETIALPVSAIEKGFPVIHTMAGDRSVTRKFNIKDPVPGSISTRLKVFTSPEGQLLDGIADMLREPYGCFEQTSSITYPNILILKYLKETNKANREVESQALEYIEKGYHRLLSFETPVNGFEWFGHTPPHEALTAYGLLEFTEMNAFLNVDKKMLARTKEFLLSRRDGNGGFNLSAKGYDKFASVPNAVANIYIVYALSQAGMGAEIETEYQAALKQAVKTEDAYQLAMMALAASNMKKVADYDRLMYMLQTHEEKGTLKAETSVVNSRDQSLKLETQALYALALCRAKEPNIGKIAMVISGILAGKSYYGYGSTQATVLALQATIEYMKLKGATAESKITCSIDGSFVSPKQSIALSGGQHTFKADYHGKDPGTPYCLEVAYSSLIPENSDAAVLKLNTTLSNRSVKIGETVRLSIEVQNLKNELQPMSIAKIAIPAGLSLQPWQLKEISEQKQVAYYELFDGYLVLYWMGFAPNEKKKVNLDLKADIPGAYRSKASNCYLYYTPEHKHWNEGSSIEVIP